MQTKKFTHALALACLVVFSAVVAVGCSCAEDEFNGQDACAKLVEAANNVLSSCSLPTESEITVCGYGMGSCVGFAGCTPKVDVEGCVTAIKTLGCNDVQSRAYAQVSACVGVLSNIETACSSSGDSD